MGHDEKLSGGLFAGTDAAICHVLGLKHARQLRQRTAYLQIARSQVSADVLIDLVRTLYRLVESNRRERKPSSENWRWKPQTYIAGKNKSPEIVLERAIALLAHRGDLNDWSNQIPVASGLVDHKSDKRAAVDLARIKDGQLDLYELKWASDTPVYAAFEILRYGLAYLLCRVNRTKFGYDDLKAMEVDALGLNVLAPCLYYEQDLTWLQAGLDAGISKVSQEQLGVDFRASFRFRVLPGGPAFASGAEATTVCTAAALEPRALDLIRTMSRLSAVCHGPADT
jgi:hypothetical protein